MKKKNINDVINTIKNDVDETEIKQDVIKTETVEPETVEPNYKDLYIKSLADYDNMKKYMNTMLSKSERSSLANTVELIISPIFNDLRRGVKNNVDGCELILNNLISNLKKLDISVIDDNIVGKSFNTDYMNAIMSIPDKNKAGTVVSVVDCGFIDDKINKTIVYANVIVYKED